LASSGAGKGAGVHHANIMHTIGVQTCPAVINPRDIRLLEMLDGAFRPPDPPPAEATHDFLVLNPHADFAPHYNSPTRPPGSA
jgi:hypothetical protein